MTAALDSLSTRAEEAPKWRPSGYSGGDCAVLAAFAPDPRLFTIESNPDIAGIGVILAFLITAYATLIFTICAYWSGLVPDELLNAVDKKIFKAKSERRPGWSEAFREGIRAFSDQQIVTGIAILASAFASVQTISVYHWRTVVYLAWMSSNVHLTTLTVLRRMLQSNSAARTMRLTGMLVLIVLLVVAIVPTTSVNFSKAATNVPYGGRWPSDSGNFTPADRAACFWEQTYMNGISKDSVLSYIILGGSYTWKIVTLFGNSHQLARKILREKPARAVPRFIKKAALWRCSKHPVVYYITAWPYSLLVGLYVLYIAVFDFFDSFAASVVILTGSLVWGTINLIVPRMYLSDYLESDENEWNFGQYLPILLLLLPVMSVVEEFSVRKDKAAPTPYCHHHHLARLGTSGSTTGSDTVELLAQRSWPTAPPSRSETQASTSSRRYYPSPAASFYSYDTPPPQTSASSSSSATAAGAAAAHIRNRSREIHIRDLDRPLTTTTNKEAPFTTTRVEEVSSSSSSSSSSNGGLERWQDEGLYASRFFRSLVWLINITLFLAAAWLFFIQFTSLVNGFMQARVALNAGWAMAMALIVMFAWVALGALCSRVSLSYS